MRTRTVSLAAIAALGFASPALANDYVGQLELGAGWASIDDVNNNTDLADDSFFLIEGAARGNIPLGDYAALQLDAGGLGTFAEPDGSADDYLKTAFYGAGHLNYRTSDYALGALVHLGSSNGGENQNANFYNFGAEGLFNFDNFTGIGQAGYFWANDETADDVMTEAWWFRAVARFYAGDDTRFQAEGSYADGEERNDGHDDTVIGWGARIDHAINGGPVAVFVGYKGMNLENDAAPKELTDHTVSIGFNLHFGAGSLREADRNGPSFDTPDVGRWTGWTTDTVAGF
ncbi:MAG: hypothetical protein ACLFWF_01385 [Alphaproteobacteria bacterium]